MPKTKEKPKEDAKATGTYKFDPKLGKVVRVSDHVPGLKKKGGFDAEPGPSCPPGGCGGCDFGG